VRVRVRVCVCVCVCVCAMSSDSVCVSMTFRLQFGTVPTVANRGIPLINVGFSGYKTESLAVDKSG